MQRERTLLNQRMFDGIGYPDDYDTDVDDLYLDSVPPGCAETNPISNGGFAGSFTVLFCR